LIYFFKGTLISLWFVGFLHFLQKECVWPLTNFYCEKYGGIEIERPKVLIELDILEFTRARRKTTD